MLLAVHILTIPTRKATQACAPLSPDTLAVSTLSRYWIPPAAFMTPSIPAARSVTIIRSPIESIPLPIYPKIEIMSEPYNKPIPTAVSIPRVSTIDTLTPHTAATMTTRYGNTSHGLASSLIDTSGAPILINMYTIRVANAAGRAIHRFALNLSAILQPCDRVAAIVVSDINDMLSPKNAPPSTTAT